MTDKTTTRGRKSLHARVKDEDVKNKGYSSDCCCLSMIFQPDVGEFLQTKRDTAHSAYLYFLPRPSNYTIQ